MIFFQVCVFFSSSWTSSSSKGDERGQPRPPPGRGSPGWGAGGGASPRAPTLAGLSNACAVCEPEASSSPRRPLDPVGLGLGGALRSAEAGPRLPRGRRGEDGPGGGSKRSHIQIRKRCVVPPHPTHGPAQPLVGGCMPRSMMRRRGGADTTAPHHSTVHKKSKSGARAGAGRGGAGLPFQSKFCAPLLCPPRTSPNLPTVNT